MDPPRVSADDDGQSTIVSVPPPLRRRVSMEEDLFYQHIMTNPRRPSQPPPYQRESSAPSASNHGDQSRKGQRVAASGGGNTNVKIKPTTTTTNITNTAQQDMETLPTYDPSISLEGIFSKKHEIENTIKRAEDRQWHTVFVQLSGTALNIYDTKKSWGWGRTRNDGPSVNPDNPPWFKKAKLEKSYSLLYADVGIAADYKKRRYAIRIRAETDQFLLCCVELRTFVDWLGALFAAIDIAAPIEDRDFPRDMSIPRIQRIRWFHGQSPTATAVDLSELGETAEEVSANPEERPLSSPSTLMPPEPQTRIEPEPEVEDEEDEEMEPSEPPPRIDCIRRLSATSYTNVEELDPGSGKWFPEHRWSSAHDMLYAKLCYSNLLFRSPRKSPYIISKGKQWYVDWATGRMVRVLPPAYGEINDYFGPWQTVHTENRRI